MTLVDDLTEKWMAEKARADRLTAENEKLTAYHAFARQNFHTMQNAANELRIRAEKAEAENERLREALDQSRIALDDWVNTYAPEFCDAARVEEARARIRQHGTLGYVATVQEQNRRALENSHE